MMVVGCLPALSAPEPPKMSEKERSQLNYYVRPIAPMVKFEKKIPLGSLLVEDWANAKVSFNKPEEQAQLGFSASFLNAGKLSKKASEEDVRKELANYFVVSSKDWMHSYSHVGTADETGSIKLADGRTLTFLIRPGGLAAVVYDDGAIVFLARELQRGMLKCGPALPNEYSQVLDAQHWKNPFVVVNADDTVILIVSGERKLIKSNELASSLIQLDANAWPYGGVLALQDNGVRAVPDTGATARNHNRILNMLRGLGLVLYPWPSG